MRRSPNPPTMQELFCELKRQDELQAPAFERDWQCALAKQRHGAGDSSGNGFRRLAIAAMVLLAIGGMVLLALRLQSPPPAVSRLAPPVESHPATSQATAVGIVEWQSPTDFMLEWAANDPLPPIDELLSTSRGQHRNF